MRYMLLKAIIGLLVLLFCALGLDAQETFPTRVAARCKGEASFAIRDCACTVYNRLEAGWSEHNVLDPYFAVDVTPTDKEVQRVRALLTTGCKEAYYFMYSKEDVYALGISHIHPLQRRFSADGTREVWFYEQGYRKR